MPKDNKFILVSLLWKGFASLWKNINKSISFFQFGSNQPKNTDSQAEQNLSNINSNKPMKKAYQTPTIDTPRLTKNLLKEKSRYKDIKTPDSIKTDDFGNLNGINDTKIVTKTRNYNKPGAKSSLWVAKKQEERETVNEMITGDLFRIILGVEAAPKYRLTTDENNELVSLSRVLPNFQQLDSASQSEVREIENFEYMLATCLIFGKKDMHTANWGYITSASGEKKAATIDHGQTLAESPRWCLQTYVQIYNIPRNIIVNEHFLQACQDAITHFKAQQDIMFTSCQKSIADLNAVMSDCKKTPEEIMTLLNQNIEELKDLCHHLHCELAIVNNQPERLKEHSHFLAQKNISFDVLSPHKAKKDPHTFQTFKFELRDLIQAEREKKKGNSDNYDDLINAYEEPSGNRIN